MRTGITAAARPAGMPKMRRRLACSSTGVAARRHQPKHLRGRTRDKGQGKEQGQEDDKSVK